MKQISLVISIVALVGVIALFFRSPKNNCSETQKAKTVLNVSDSNQNIVPENQAVYNIAYIDAQRITNEYEYYKEIAQELEQKQKRAESQFVKKAEAFQNELNEYQRKAQMGAFLSAESQQSQEMALREKQESLAQLEQDLSIKLQTDLQKLDAQAHDTIMKYLKAFNQAQQYDLILNSATILDAGQTKDVTDTILSILNQKYHAQKSDK